MSDNKKTKVEHFKNGNKSKKHGFWFYFLNALCWSIIGFFLIFGGLEFADKKSGYRVLNSHVAVVVSESMSKVNSANLDYLDPNVEHIQIGDIIKAKEYKSFEEVNILDIVIYSSKDGTLICHRVIDKYVDSVKGNCLVTRGDANDADDTPITFDICRGKVVSITPKLGKVIMFMQTPYMLLAIFGSGFFVLLGILITGLNKDKKNKSNDDKGSSNSSKSKEEKQPNNKKTVSKETKSLVIPLISIISIATLGCIGIANSLYVKDVNQVGFSIGAVSKHTLRFFTEYNGSSWTTYSDSLVTDGGSISLSDIPTPSLNDYTFKGWNINIPSSSNYSVTYTSAQLSSLTISDDAIFYPILESNSDYAYTNSTYYEANTDVTIASSSISSTVLGKRYAGISGIPNPVADWNDSRNLVTSSGVYKFVNEGGGANLYRKVGFKPNSNWKTNWGSGTPAFFIHSWINEWTNNDVLMGNSLTDGKVYCYIPATYQYLMFVRNDHDNTSINWDNFNKSDDLDLSNAFMNSTKYTSSTIVLEMDGSADWNSWGSGNSKWIS